MMDNRFYVRPDLLLENGNSITIIYYIFDLILYVYNNYDILLKLHIRNAIIGFVDVCQIYSFDWYKNINLYSRVCIYVPFNLNTGNYEIVILYSINRRY